MMRRAPVQRWPHFSVISLPTSLMKRSNSGRAVAGVASGPSTMLFKLSASMLKGTLSAMMRGWAFSMRPVRGAAGEGHHVLAFDMIKIPRCPRSIAVHLRAGSCFR
jgi:hypothetical protein